MLSYEGAWNNPELAWLKNVEPRKSLTELEMELAVLAHGRDKYENNAFFFLRSGASLKSIPDAFRDHFESSRDDEKEKLKSLKARIKKFGAEVIQGYPATFGGFIEDKPIMIGLDVFAQTVADCIWNALVRLEPSKEMSPQYVINQGNAELFVGRKVTLNDARSVITRLFRTGGILAVSGKPGLGKTAFMGELYNSMDFSRSRTAYVAYFADYVMDDDDASAASDGVVGNLWKQISRHPEMHGVFLDDEVDPRALVTSATSDVLRRRFPTYLTAVAKAGRRLVIFLDGFDNLYDRDCGASSTEGFDWLPAKLPEGIVGVLSLRQGSKFSGMFLGEGFSSVGGSLTSARKPQGIVTLGPLLVNERVDLVKNLLAKHGKTLSDTSTTARVSNAVCCSGGLAGRTHIYKTNQMRALTSKKDAGNPMYLRLVVEEIRIFGVFEKCALNEFDGSLWRTKAEASLQTVGKSVALTEWRNRPKRRQDPCEAVLTGFKEPLLSCAVSLGGKFVAVGADDGVVRLHDLTTTKEVATFVGHGAGVVSLCFVGLDRLCSGSDDGQLCMWDVDRQYRIHSVQGHGRRLAGITVSPDFMSFITVGWDCKIKIWNSNDCREISCITHPLLPVSCVCHHPERNAIVTGGWDATIRIWDTVTLRRIAILRGHAGSVRAVAISACGLVLASGSVHGTVKLWSSALGVEIGTFKTTCGGPINAVAFTANAKSVVSAGVDGRVIVWPTNSCRRIKHYPVPISQGITMIQLNPSLTCAAVGFRDGKVRVYDFDGAGRAPRLNVTIGATSVSGICYIEDVVLVAFCETSNILHLMRTSGPYVRRETIELIANVSSVEKIRDGWIAVGCTDGMLRIFEVQWQNFEEGSSKYPNLELYLLYHGDGPVAVIAVSTDASWIATASGQENGLTIWKNPVREEAKPATAGTADVAQKGLFHGALSNLHSDVITCATWGRAFEKDFLVTGSADASVVIYSVEKSRMVFHLRGHATSIASVKAQKWADLVREVDPDIRGYNIQNFDLNYLMNRSAHLGVKSFPYFGRVRDIKTTVRDQVLQSKQLGKREAR